MIAAKDQGEEAAARRLRTVATVLLAAADRYLERAPEAMSPAEQARVDAAAQLVWRACLIVRAASTSEWGI